jgi:hypothetical protein
MTRLMHRERRNEVRQLGLPAASGTDPVTAPFTDRVEEAVAARGVKRRLAAATAELPSNPRCLAGRRATARQDRRRRAAESARARQPVRVPQNLGAGSICTGRPSAKSKSVPVAVPGDCVPQKPEEVQFWYPVSSLCATGAFLKDGSLTKFSDKADSVDPQHFSCRGNMNYPTYRFLQALPTDPHALLRLIQQTNGRQGLYWEFFTIGTLLYNAPPPPVTAALYRAAALIPGVTVVPDATDTIGRPASRSPSPPRASGLNGSSARRPCSTSARAKSTSPTARSSASRPSSSTPSSTTPGRPRVKPAG